MQLDLLPKWDMHDADSVPARSGPQRNGWSYLEPPAKPEIHDAGSVPACLQRNKLVELDPSAKRRIADIAFGLTAKAANFPLPEHSQAGKELDVRKPVELPLPAVEAHPALDSAKILLSPALTAARRNPAVADFARMNSTFAAA